jgi:hypothetical protein
MRLTADIYRSAASLPRHELLIAEELQYLSGEETQRLLAYAEGVGRALSGLITSLREKAA